MGFKEWVWDINWSNAFLWTMGFLVVQSWLFPNYFEMFKIFGFWISIIIEFLFVFLIVLFARPPGVKKIYTIIHNKCHRQFSSLAEYNKHIKICKGKEKKK
jgi:hypothetical protein